MDIYLHPRTHAQRVTRGVAPARRRPRHLIRAGGVLTLGQQAVATARRAEIGDQLPDHTFQARYHCA